MFFRLLLCSAFRVLIPAVSKQADAGEMSLMSSGTWLSEEVAARQAPPGR